MTPGVCRAEVVGSMLRPASLLRARERHARRDLADAELKRAEDRAVDLCVAIQEAAGVDVLTDGEMRRNVFASQLAQAVDGFAAISANTVDWFHLDGTKETSPVTLALVAKLKRKRHLSAEEFVYVRARTMRATKITLPSPTMYAYYWVPGVSDSAYSSTDAYMADVTDILKDEVRELARLGCTYVQFDAPELGMVLDRHQQEWFAHKGFEPRRMVHEGIDLMNAIIDEPSARQAGVTFGLHVCRGNDATRYMAKGSYAAIADEILRRSHARVLLLEYDDERSGDFAPLAHATEDKIVVLGLVSTKRPRLETEEELVARITEASQYVPLDRLALSTQCGFASVAKGNNIPFELQDQKLSLVARVARRLWG